MAHLNCSAFRQALNVFGLFGLLWFSWSSHSVTLFNGLASPLFFALAAYIVVLTPQYRVAVSRQSLFFFALFTAWVIFTDTQSSEILPALTMDSHWLILPLATLLIAQVLREYPIAFQTIQVGAALCIINLLLTLYANAEWHIHWHYPPIFGHIRHLGLSIGLLTIFLFTKNGTQEWVSVFFRLSRIIGLALVFWSGTRASMLALFCCSAIFIYAERSWAKILLIDSIAAIALSIIPEPALPYGGIPGAIKLSLNATSADALSSFRLSIWQSTLSGLSNIEKLWMGVGGNGFARLQVIHGVKISAPGHVQPHNFIIQSICDWGIIGLTLLAGFFYQSTLRPVISDRKHNDPTALAGIVYLLVTGMFDATLYHLEYLIYLAIAIAYLMSNKKPKDSIDILIPTSVAIAFVLGLVLIHSQTMDYRIHLFWYFPT